MIQPEQQSSTCTKMWTMSVEWFNGWQTTGSWWFLFNWHFV